MLAWPHSGFHGHTAVWIHTDDRAFATRLARYCARNPVALERLTYDRIAKAVTYRSDKVHGPTAGTEPVDPLEVLVQVLVHIPDKGGCRLRPQSRFSRGADGAWSAILRASCHARERLDDCTTGLPSVCGARMPGPTPARRAHPAVARSASADCGTPRDRVAHRHVARGARRDRFTDQRAPCL